MTGMVAGALIVNFASHHTRAFHEIEHIQWPLMIVFFILAGASLELGSVKALDLVGLSFIALRAASRLMGGWIGAYFAGAASKERNLFGMALLPQAGITIGTTVFLKWSDDLPRCGPSDAAANLGSRSVGITVHKEPRSAAPLKSALRIFCRCHNCRL